MARCLRGFLACLAASGAAAHEPLRLPSQWTDDLVISLWRGGGMRHESLEIRCTAQACTHDRMEQGRHAVRSAPVSKADRDALLRELASHHLDEVIVTHLRAPVPDRGRTSLCVAQGASRQCLDSGGDQVIQDKRFGQACAALEKFVLDRLPASPAR